MFVTWAASELMMRFRASKAGLPSSLSKAIAVLLFILTSVVLHAAFILSLYNLQVPHIFYFRCLMKTFRHEYTPI